MLQKTPWPKLVAGLILVFALFQWTASALHSDRGQAGALVATIVVAATLLVERALFSSSLGGAARALGLFAPARRGLVGAAVVGLALLLVLPLYMRIARTSLAMQPGWPWLLPGLFAQAGIAEETLFRGYLFGHLRRGRSFWRAASLAAVPFTAVHLLLFLTMPWPVAAASVLLAVILSFPLAHLFELGGGTIWGPAILHFVVQGAIKSIAIPVESTATLPLVWMAASAVVPFLVFLFPRMRSSGNPVA
jgi:membrane protease YdiL (CAAX protease family)